MKLSELKVLLDVASVCCSDDTRIYIDNGRDGASAFSEVKIALERSPDAGGNEYILVVK